MVYPNQHLYLTMHWSQQGATQEFGQSGLRFDAAVPATQALVDAAAAPLATFWTTAISGIETGYSLQFCRLAALGVDGNYVPDTVAFDHVFSGTTGGGGATTARFPLAVALAATLLTDVPRGLANRGRMYLPWFNTSLGTDFLFPAASVNNRSNTLAAMIGGLNDVMPGPATVFAKKGAGAKHAITKVMHGRRPDTQRRRQNQLAESYGTVWNVP